jgi:myo-inositol-1(or 4)-monophosphatase
VLNILAFFDEYRNIGSAVLHLCYAAAGQLDGAFAHSTRLWDIAAGGLILEEAGGAIMDFSLRPLFPLSGALETYKTTPVPFVATGRCENATLLRPFFVD